MVRQMHDLTDNKRLLDKHARLETLLETLRGEGLPEDELAYVSTVHLGTHTRFLTTSWILYYHGFVLTQLSDSMTAAEKSLVARIHSMNDHLTLGQTQADDTILILESYLKFSSMT